MRKGSFIVFEGIEGCGKTTQAILLAERLKRESHNVVLTREPGGTDFGEKIRNLLLHSDEVSSITELFLFLADRKEHIEKLIKPSLQNGKIVISDRYFYSTLAYQIGGRGMDKGFVEDLNRAVVNDVVPDLVFYLDITVEEAFIRKSNSKLDRIEKESLEFHQNIRNHYLKILREYTNIVKIDGRLAMEEIHRSVYNMLNEKKLI
ncbi:MAG: dTMP kinase [Brevinematia bacterium]